MRNSLIKKLNCSQSSHLSRLHLSQQTTRTTEVQTTTNQTTNIAEAPVATRHGSSNNSLVRKTTRRRNRPHHEVTRAGARFAVSMAIVHVAALNYKHQEDSRWSKTSSPLRKTRGSREPTMSPARHTMQPRGYWIVEPHIISLPTSTTSHFTNRIMEEKK